MSISNEALQKLLAEIEQKAAVSQQQIAIVKAQIAGKSRESRVLQLTTNELDTLPPDTRVYDGIGKFFVQTKPADIKTRNEKQAEDLKREKTDLEKRLHYLETTAKNSQAHIDQMLKSGRA